MKKKVFYAACLYPTGTLLAGKEYDVIDETDEKIVVINENANKVSLNRYRFGEIFMKEIDDGRKTKAATGEVTIKCINGDSFRWLTTDKEYKLEKETDKFFTVINDFGVSARYHKKYFEVTEMPAEAPPEPKGNVAECKYPYPGELSFKKSYVYEKIRGNNRVIRCINDKGENKEYLANRFLIKK